MSVPYCVFPRYLFPIRLFFIDLPEEQEVRAGVLPLKGIFIIVTLCQVCTFNVYISVLFFALMSIDRAGKEYSGCGFARGSLCFTVDGDSFRLYMLHMHFACVHVFS